MKRKITDREIQEALMKCCGNLVLFKQEYPHITESKLNAFLKKNANIILLAKSQLIDMAEKSLIENLNSKNDAVKERAAEFVLSRRSKDYKVDTIEEAIVNSSAIKEIFGM